MEYLQAEKGDCGGLSMSLPLQLCAAAFLNFIAHFMGDVGHISQWSTIMAGSLAGMVFIIVVYSTDFIKTRSIVQNMLEPSYRGSSMPFLLFINRKDSWPFIEGFSLQF